MRDTYELRRTHKRKHSSTANPFLNFNTETGARYF